MTEVTEVYEAVEAKWNLLSDCIPIEDGCYVIGTEFEQMGLAMFADGRWFNNIVDGVGVEVKEKIIKWFSVSIPDPREKSNE